MTTLLQDLRYGFRMLGRNPGFMTVAVLTLALGIGANTAMFSVVDAVLLRPLPYPQPDRLVMVWESWQGHNDDLAPADFLDVRQQNHVFTAMAGFKSQSFEMTSGEGASQAAQIDGAIVSASFFSVLGIQPKLGRGFSTADGEPGAARVVVLSAALWQAQFGGTPLILGRKLLLNREPYTVVGVMPPGFDFPEAAEL